MCRIDLIDLPNSTGQAAESGNDPGHPFLIYFRGEPYAVTHADHDALADMAPDIAAGELTADQAAAWILFTAGRLTRKQYEETIT